MASKIQQFFFDTKLYKWGVKWAKKTHFINPELSLYLVGAIFIKKLKDNEINMKAGAVAFNFTLAIFPAIIFLFTLVPYFPIQDLQDEIFKFIGDVSPESIYGVAESTVFDIINKPREGLLSFGFITALLFASNGMQALMSAFDSCYGAHRKKRSSIRKRLVAAMLTFLLATILFLTILLIIGGKVILNTVFDFAGLDRNYLYDLINITRYLAVFLMFFLAVSVIYYWAPSVPSRWSFISVGSVLATTLCILVSVVFSFYIDNFGLYNKVYGSIGAMIGIMIWLYAIANVLLIGFEVNSTIDTAKHRLKRLERQLQNEIEGTTVASDWEGSRDRY